MVATQQIRDRSLLKVREMLQSRAPDGVIHDKGKDRRNNDFAKGVLAIASIKDMAAKTYVYRTYGMAVRAVPGVFKEMSDEYLMAVKCTAAPVKHIRPLGE